MNKRRLAPGALVDVKASDGSGLALYRVINDHIVPTSFHGYSDKWSSMRRYDWKGRRFLRARPVQVSRIVKVHSKETNPLDTPKRNNW